MRDRADRRSFAPGTRLGRSDTGSSLRANVTGRASSERAGDGAGHARTRAVGTTAALDVEGWLIRVVLPDARFELTELRDGRVVTEEHLRERRRALSTAVGAENNDDVTTRSVSRRFAIGRSSAAYLELFIVRHRLLGPARRCVVIGRTPTAHLTSRRDDNRLSRATSWAVSHGVRMTALWRNKLHALPNGVCGRKLATDH